MSTWFTVGRQAWRNVRHRPVESLMLLVALCLATSSIAIGSNVRASATGAIERLSDSTNGYHVYVKKFYGPETPEAAHVAATQAIADIAAMDEVAATAGPWPVVPSSTPVGDALLDVRVQVRDTTVSPVDQPFVVTGDWFDATTGGSGQGVVVEDGLAESLKVGPGDAIELSGQAFNVLGTAMSTTTGRFPFEAPGLIWIDADSAARLPTGLPSYEWTVFRLDQPKASPDVAERINGALPHTDRLQWEVHEWQERQADEEGSSPVNELGTALLAAGTLLAILAAATAAVLIGSRLNARSRQIGVLKAIGMSPRHVTAVFAAEAAALAVVAVVVGVVAGAVLAPKLARTVATVYGGPQVPLLSPTRTLVLVAIATGMVLIAVVNPARKAARIPPTRLLQPPVQASRRVGLFGRLARIPGLPVSVGIAGRSIGRRRSRLVANIVSLSLAVALAVLGLALGGSAALPAMPADMPRDPLADASAQELFDKLRAVVLIAAALLVALAVLNTIVTAAFSISDARRNHAVLATLGATRQRIAVGFIAAQLAVALTAAITGIVLGHVLYALFADDLGPPALNPLTYPAIVAVTIVGYAFVQLVALRRQAGTPITNALTAERR